MIFSEEFILDEDPKNYHFLSNGMVSVPDVKDSAAEFTATVDSMKIMGMTDEDLSGIYINKYVVYLFYEWFIVTFLNSLKNCS